MLEIAFSLCWVTQNLVRILSITASCFAARDEARRTRTVVHKLLLLQSLLRDTSTELQLFTIQLLKTNLGLVLVVFFLSIYHLHTEWWELPQLIF
jgi:hypothetical protein